MLNFFTWYAHWKNGIFNHRVLQTKAYNYTESKQAKYLDLVARFIHREEISCKSLNVWWQDATLIIYLFFDRDIPTYSYIHVSFIHYIGRDSLDFSSLQSLSQQSPYF
jgi:hypothetical protein